MGKLPQAPVSQFGLTFSRYGDFSESDFAGLRRNPPIASSATKIHSAFDTTMSVEPQTQKPFGLFILPLFNAMYSYGVIDFKLTFDPSSQKYLYVPASLVRKICSLVLSALLIIFVYMESEYQQYVKRQTDLTSIMALMKTLQIGYISLRVCFFYIMHTRGHQFSEILNELLQVSADLESEGCGPPQSSFCTTFAKGLLTAMLTYGIMYVLEPFLGVWYQGHSPGLVEACADTMVKSFVVTVDSFGFNVPTEWFQYKIYEHEPYWVVAIAAAVKVVSHYLFSCVWVFAVMLIIFWALAFSNVFRTNVEALLAQGSSRSTLEDIRKFNLITAILDKFNETMAPLTFIACVNCIAHFSIYIQYLVDSDIWWYGKINVAFGLAYFGGMLIAGSDVNQEAGRIIKVVKLRYQHTQTWGKCHHGTCDEVTQGLQLLLTDIQMNNIGFKGLKFFTISYSFIGTVLSVMSTYAMVVLQVKNNKE